MQPRTNAKLRKVTMIGWHGRLSEASTQDAVVGVVQDFVSILADSELDELPTGCRPGPMTNAQQVTVFALMLAHRHDGDPKTAPALHRVATFFTKAALRIYQIGERSHEVAAERGAPRRVAGNG
ncbi:MAG TPA: hypothetical protein VM122_09510 [Usitatibacter sp.]|nr:hypothetical protein [Usitatibacter sp.]